LAPQFGFSSFALAVCIRKGISIQNESSLYFWSKISTLFKCQHHLRLAFEKMAEPDNIPDDGYVFAAKRRKGIGKDLNPDSFWMDMPLLISCIIYPFMLCGFFLANIFYD
jgi:hypothetical protein